jgi:cobalt/nickel transport system permease protein
MNKVAPESVTGVPTASMGRSGLPAKAVAIVAVLALVCGGVLSWFASAYPDGLEWAMFKTAGVEELESSDGVHEALGKVQESTAFLPDYGFKVDGAASGAAEKAEAAWPAPSAGASAAGVVGSAITLAIAALVGYLLYSSVRLARKSGGRLPPAFSCGGER